MNSVSPSTFAGLPSSRTPKPPANTTLPSWTMPNDTPGTPSCFCRVSTNFVELGDPRRVELVRLLARERLARRSPSAAAGRRSAPTWRAALLADAPAPCRRSPRSSAPFANARPRRRRASRSATSDSRSRAMLRPAVLVGSVVGDLERPLLRRACTRAHAAATAASASFAWTSTSAMCESPSGGSRIVAGAAHRRSTSRPAAMNVLPATVVFGVSASSFSTRPTGCRRPPASAARAP